jgi:hypothetical protein
LWTEGVKGAKIHACLCAQYGNNALPHQSVHKWIEMFKSGWTSVMDAKRPSTSTTGDKQKEARAIILANRRNHITTRHQSRFGLFFIARQSWVPQSFCKVGAQTSDRRT